MSIKKTLDPADLKRLVAESGMTIYAIEKGVGMPLTSLDKCLKAVPDKKGYVRTLPAKWELPLLKFLKEKKAQHEDVKIERKEILEERGIEIPLEIPEAIVPVMQGRREWIDKLIEVKESL